MAMLRSTLKGAGRLLCISLLVIHWLSAAGGFALLERHIAGHASDSTRIASDAFEATIAAADFSQRNPVSVPDRNIVAVLCIETARIAFVLGCLCILHAVAERYRSRLEFPTCSVRGPPAGMVA